MVRLALIGILSVGSILLLLLDQAAAGQVKTFTTQGFFGPKSCCVLTGNPTCRVCCPAGHSAVCGKGACNCK